MSTATATKPVKLIERHNLTRDSVDVSEGIIRGVLAVGLKSRNTGRSLGLDRGKFGDALDQPYEYSPEALRNSAPLYEGVAVRVNHPKFKRGPNGERIVAEGRVVNDLLGELKNVRFVEGKGLVADLHYLKSHDLSSRLAEVADRMPDKLALSHNADGTPELVNGRVVITAIETVESVDLIGDKPGTTNGLFESEDTEPSTMKMKISAILTEAAKGDSEQAKHAKRLIEMDAYGEMATEMDVPAEASGEDQMQEALDTMILAVFHGEGTAEEKLKKIGAIVGAVEDSDSESTTTTEETSDDSSEEANKESAKVEERFNKLEATLGNLTTLVEKLAPKKPGTSAPKRLHESADERSYDEIRKGLFPVKS